MKPVLLDKENQFLPPIGRDTYDQYNRGLLGERDRSNGSRLRNMGSAIIASGGSNIINNHQRLASYETNDPSISAYDSPSVN